MTILSLRKISHGFGGAPLLKEASLVVNKDEKLCLLGRNGTGKSTLMKIIAGLIEPDSGIVEIAPNIKISMLNQTFPADIDKPIAEVIAEDQEDLEPYKIQRIMTKLNLDADANFFGSIWRFKTQGSVSTSIGQ